MNKLGLVILIILVVGIATAVFLYSMARTTVTTKTTAANSDNPSLNYQTVGTVKIYNTSALIPFLSEYINNSYIELTPQVVEYGILYFIKIDNISGVIGYFKGGMLSSFAFTQLNQTLTSHGFKYAEYQNLLYDYNNKTAIGFDGKYFYLVHESAKNQTLTINLLYYLYESNKTFSPMQTNIIATGTFEKGNFTAYANNSQIIVKAYFEGNFSILAKLLKFFSFTTSNFSATGNVVFKNATVEVYSLNITSNGKTLYILIGFKEAEQNIVYAVGVISSQQISLKEVLSLL